MCRETREYYKKSLQEHSGKPPNYECRVSDAAPYLRTILGLDTTNSQTRMLPSPGSSNFAFQAGPSNSNRPPQLEFI